MKDIYLELLRYSNWADLTVAKAAVNSDASPKVFEILSHIHNANTIWLDRLCKRSSDVNVWDVHDKLVLLDKISASDMSLIGFVESANESIFHELISYKNSKGEPFQSKVADILNQLVTHSAYHRGQVISLLKGISDPLPVTDFIYYSRSVKES